MRSYYKTLLTDPHNRKKASFPCISASCSNSGQKAVAGAGPEAGGGDHQLPARPAASSLPSHHQESVSQVSGGFGSLFLQAWTIPAVSEDMDSSYRGLACLLETSCLLSASPPCFQTSSTPTSLLKHACNPAALTFLCVRKSTVTSDSSRCGGLPEITLWVSGSPLQPRAQDGGQWQSWQSFKDSSLLSRPPHLAVSSVPSPLDLDQEKEIY